jgi:hypothetical protein
MQIVALPHAVMGTGPPPKIPTREMFNGVVRTGMPLTPKNFRVTSMQPQPRRALCTRLQPVLNVVNPNKPIGLGLSKALVA